MDQEAWDQIYGALESDIEALKRRGAAVAEGDIILEIDRARFAMERGDVDEAIARVQRLRTQLSRAYAAATSRSGATPSATADRLDALEDSLHASTRLGSARLEIVGEDEEPPTRAASQNTKVNKSIKYDDIKDEYLKHWNTCTIRESKASAVRREADRIIANRAVYEEISGETGVPWWFIGLIHGMECSFSLNKHLHNGDSLKARTWQVPAGRPKNGSPVFTFVDSAVDALEYDGFAGKHDWPLPMVLYRLERYNGFGYRRKFGFASPYLWSYTNHFTSGKYVRDGVFDANAESKQCGTAAMLRDLIERGIVSFDNKLEAAVAAAPKPAAPEMPAPAPGPAAAPASAVTPVSTPSPASVVASVPAGAPGAAPEVTPGPAVTPAPVVKPVEVAAVVAPAAPAAPAPVVPTAAVPAPAVPAPTPVPAPAAAPDPAAASAPIAPVPTTSAPAPAPAAPTSSPPAGPAGAPGVSNAVAAALAELAKRSK